VLPILSSLALTFCLAAQALELTCVSGKISQIEFGKLKEESSNYCFNGDKTVLLSKNCQQKKCRAFEDKRKFKISLLVSQIGKPGFKLCRELGGQPEIVNFFVQNRSYKLDRCLFKDGSFADSDFLLAHYLER
jgi:hypothetical protein